MWNIEGAAKRSELVENKTEINTDMSRGPSGQEIGMIELTEKKLFRNLKVLRTFPDKHQACFYAPCVSVLLCHASCSLPL